MKVNLVLPISLFRRCPLIGLGYLSAYLRERGHHVKVFDLNTELDVPFDYDEQKWNDREFVESFLYENNHKVDSIVNKIMANTPDIVGLSLWATTKHFGLTLASKIKQMAPDTLIVCGGPESSFNATDLIHHEAVDIVVCGEGEETLREIVDIFQKKRKIDFCAGALLKNNGDITDCGMREEIENLDTLPFPDYSDFSLHKYYSPHSLSMTFYRGCLRRCVFCNCAVTWRSFRSRTADNIFKEMEYRIETCPQLHKLEIDDTAINLNLPMLSRLCDLIIANGLKINWGGSALARKEMDTELIKKMFQAGCNCLGFGLESGSQKMVDSMGKGFKIEDAERVIRDTHDAGIETILGIIIGFPGETESDFQETLEFIRRNKDYISWVHTPSECCIGCNSYMDRHIEKFDAILEPHASGLMWHSKEGSNTHEIRQKRIEVFNKFIESVGVSSKHYSTVYQSRP